ncbi:hypothetical protein ILUMI_13880 [Ignelater luminosus]|uniref:Sodefrin-like factor n=1 Tax=Ignelater luminosus TaxID=2038154 RepID=A0A8K0CRG8_IGNLU|nr:hypothetical protein ILUMI_13880 [Ignelater luminosus]
MKMVKLEILWLCVFSVLILEFCQAEALQCYECKGGPNSNCAKGVISSMKLVECPGGSLAMCQQTDIRAKNYRIFGRGCTYSSNPDFCTLIYRLLIQNPSAMKVYSCNTCSTPKCNRHGSLTESVLQ